MGAPSLIGMRFGKLKVVERSENYKDGSARWRCRCDCGAETVCMASGLRNGHSKSCGCERRRKYIEAITKHGSCRREASTLTYKRWQSMRARAGKKKCYVHVKVCKRWNNFENFLNDMGECPPGRTLGRIRNSRGYTPSNCRWETASEQALNTSRNRIVRIRNQSMPLTQWARSLGLDPELVRTRLKRGWSERAALLTPLGESRFCD